MGLENSSLRTELAHAQQQYGLAHTTPNPKPQSPNQTTPSRKSLPLFQSPRVHLLLSAVTCVGACSSLACLHTCSAQHALRRRRGCVSHAHEAVSHTRAPRTKLASQPPAADQVGRAAALKQRLDASEEKVKALESSGAAGFTGRPVSTLSISKQAEPPSHSTVHTAFAGSRDPERGCVDPVWRRGCRLCGKGGLTWSTPLQSAARPSRAQGPSQPPAQTRSPTPPALCSKHAIRQKAAASRGEG
eukprot:3635954-Rhodomonas_salina.1